MFPQIWQPNDQAKDGLQLAENRTIFRRLTLEEQLRGEVGSEPQATAKIFGHSSKCYVIHLSAFSYTLKMSPV